MTNSVQLRDGTRVPLAELPSRVPHAAFQGSLHAEVCERIATLRRLAPEIHRVYVNLIFKRSERAKELTALIHLARVGNLDPVAIESNFFDKEYADLLPGSVLFASDGPRPGPAIGRVQLRRFAVKVAAHLAFRLLRRRHVRAQNIIRAWVDTTDSTYPGHVGDATLFIYPFAGGARRQLRYLIDCSRNGRAMSLMGLPFRISNVIAALRSRDDWDVRIAREERRAFLEHAEEIQETGATTLLSTDEFEAAVCEFHADLKRRGIRSVNRSHGVAVYGPYVCYSEFSFLNRFQRAFYLQRGDVDAYEYLPSFTGAATTPRQASSDYQPGVVYLQGNWRRAGKQYEARFEDHAIMVARDVCARVGLPFGVKLHPNCTKRESARLRTMGIRGATELESLHVRHPIFLNLASSAGYTFLPQGPVHFLVDDLLDPTEIFGKGIDCLRVEALEDSLVAFRSAAAWNERHAAQIENVVREAESLRAELAALQPA